MYIFNLKMYISRLSLYIFRLKIENCIRKHRFLYARRGIYYYGIKKRPRNAVSFFMLIC